NSPCSILEANKAGHRCSKLPVRGGACLCRSSRSTRGRSVPTNRNLNQRNLPQYGGRSGLWCGVGSDGSILGQHAQIKLSLIRTKNEGPNRRKDHIGRGFQERANKIYRRT